MIHIGDFIRSFQIANGIKSVDIATKLGMSRGSYSALLSRANPTVHTLMKVCQAMDADINEVVPFDSFY